MTRVETLYFPDDKPAEPGWYGTVHGWEVHIEGAFGGAHFWDGTTWLDEEGGKPADLPIFEFTDHRFASEAGAEAYADAHLGW